MGSTWAGEMLVIIAELESADAKEERERRAAVRKSLVCMVADW